MSKEEIKQRLQRTMQKSPYRVYVRRISLFGSQLHGSATGKSDIDLLIELQKPMSMLKLVHFERDLGEALGQKVDVNTPMSLSRYFRDDVLREAEPMFEAAL